MHKALSQASTGALRFGKRVIGSRRFLFMGFMALLTVVILGWLVYQQRDLFSSYRWEFRPLPALLSFALYSVCLFQNAGVWSQVMRALGGNVVFRKHFRFYTISLLARRLPGTVWYIPWRAKMYESMGISMRLVSVAAGIELAVSIISGILVSLIFAIPILVQYQSGVWIVAALALLCLAVLHPATIRLIGRLLRVELEQLRYQTILWWIAQYCAFWVLSGAMLFSMVNIVYPLPIHQIGYVIGAWTITISLSFSLALLPSNFGFTEIGLSLLLAAIVPSPIAVISAVGSRILLITFELAWAGVMVLLEYAEKGQLTP